LLFRFVILGSPEKPKGPGEGALWQVWLQVIGGKLLAGFSPITEASWHNTTPAARLIAVDTRIIQKNGFKSKPFHSHKPLILL
jgi:hypothetical protein